MKEKTISDIIKNSNEDVSLDGRWNWYGLTNEEEIRNEMIQFDEMIHTYMNDNLKAEVGVINKSFGIRMWKDNVWVKDELYEGHSETYAEDAADNYVLGVKKL